MFGVERLTGGIAHKVERLFRFSESMNALGQPFTNRRDVPFFKQRRHVEFFFERLFELRRVHIAERIRRKIAEAAARPMDVLQHADRIVVRADAKILLIFLIPYVRQVRRFDIAGKQLLFDFVADDNVKRIRQFIGFNPDQRRLRLIDRPVKRIQRNAGKLRWRVLRKT